MNFTDKYHQMGLRCNPFISTTTDDLITTEWCDRGLSNPPPVKAKLFVQVEGKEGTGKTSHLLYWQRQTQGVYKSYPPRRFHQYQNRWDLPPVSDIVYWDEAQEIPLPLLFIALAQAARHNSTIVAATHTNLTWVAKLVGFKVKIMTIPSLDVDTLWNWANLRIQTAKLAGTTKVGLELTPEIVTEILLRAGGCWRAAATYLHIWAATAGDQH